MEIARDLITFAWTVKRQFEVLSDNAEEAQQMLNRLDSVASLCRLIVADPEKRLWETVGGELREIRISVQHAGKVADEALPLKDAGWASSTWRGVKLFANAKSIKEHLVASNAHMDRAIAQVTAKLGATNAANISGVLATLARMERSLAHGRAAEERDVAVIATAFRLDAQRLGTKLHSSLAIVQRGVSSVDASVLEVKEMVRRLLNEGGVPPTPPPSAHILFSDLKFDKDPDADSGILELGRGSFCSVYSAKYSGNGQVRAVAVKQLPASRLRHADVAKLKEEAALQMRISHPNIVRVLGFAVNPPDSPRPKYGIVMERLHETLHAVLERASGNNDPPPTFAGRLSALHQVAAGLAHLHRKRIIHADLKPQNVMLTGPEDGSQLKLTDFNIAKEAGTGGSFRGTIGGGPANGTVAWMAPELLRAPDPPLKPARESFRTDVYSFGILAWQLLALSPDPFPGFNEQQVRDAVLRGQRPDLDRVSDQVPDALRILIARCWDEEPFKRPRCGGDILEALLD